MLPPEAGKGGQHTHGIGIVLIGAGWCELCGSAAPGVAAVQRHCTQACSVAAAELVPKLAHLLPSPSTPPTHTPHPFISDTSFSGRPSYGNTYSAVNAMAGHLNSFGPTAPVPKKRLERMVKVGGVGVYVLVCGDGAGVVGVAWVGGWVFTAVSQLSHMCGMGQGEWQTRLPTLQPAYPSQPSLTHPSTQQELEDAEKFLARGR